MEGWAYSNWNATPEGMIGYCSESQQMLQEPYPNGYSLDPTAAIYMTGYHAMEYDFSVNFDGSCRTDLCPSSRIYMSPYGDIEQCTQYPQASWSPSEPSVASLSPPYDCNWGQTDSIKAVPDYDDPNEEVLQGLGLYDCPELAPKDKSSGGFGSFDVQYTSQGRGLKLEESFELTEGYFQNNEDSE
ncbi:hypothetical protein AA313_de0204910 [Arthrobotrys entomopaga]|nr:hypothetical protein AA313_de0204910 [Arthrobotrys entomopaga]